MDVVESAQASRTADANLIIIHQQKLDRATDSFLPQESLAVINSDDEEVLEGNLKSSMSMSDDNDEDIDDSEEKDDGRGEEMSFSGREFADEEEQELNDLVPGHQKMNGLRT